MRTAGLALLGFGLGAVAGATLAYGAVWLWFDVLGLKGPIGSFLPSLDVLLVLAPLLGSRRRDIGGLVGGASQSTADMLNSAVSLVSRRNRRDGRVRR